jgi:P pilus assembly chaperone PapD
MRIAYSLWAAAISLLAIAQPAHAQGYQIQPMLATIRPTGPDSRLTLSIKNTGEVPIMLEMIPFRASVNETGTPTRVPEDKDLLVYPAQTAIPPGREQTVQIRYIGDAALAEARMYGVRVAQLPIDFRTGAAKGGANAQADVKVSFNFLSHIIVSPESARSDIVVEVVEHKADGGLALRLRNPGTGIAVLNSARWTFTDASGKSVELDTDHVQLGDFSALLPHQDRLASVAAKDVPGLTGTITSKLEIP